MLFDPMILIEQPQRVLAVVGIIMLGKTLAAFALVLALRYPLNSALTVSASLAQIGEFSFILAGLGVSLHLLPLEGQNLILAGAMLSIAMNPLLFAAVEPFQAWIRKRSRLARAMEQRNDPLAVLPMSTDLSKLTGHVLLVGYGKLGRRLGAALASQGRSLVVAEENREVVEELRERNIPAVSGDASDPAVLVQAHVARAKVLLITTPDVLKARRMVEVARMLNPDIEVLIHARNADEAALLRAERVGEVVLAEEALEAMVDAHLKSRAQGR
jgi:CPA2 family monovalent cation:H+ antiporter-2